MRPRTLAYAIAMTALSASEAHAQTGASELLAHIRPSERASLASALGVTQVEQLPTYDLHLSVDGQLRGFGLREGVVFTNTEAAPMRDVAMRIFVNASVARGATPPVRFLEGRCLEGVSCTITQPAPSVVMVRLAEPLAPGATLHFELDLQGTMTEIDDARLSMMAQSMEGLASLEGGESSTHGDYGLVAHGAQIGSIASFYPVLARRTRGRWITNDGGTMGDLSTDAPHHVRARIVVPENFTIAASGAEVSVANVNDPAGSPRRKEVTINAAAVREFAVLVSPVFEEANCDVNGTRIRSFYLREDRAAGRHVRDVACASLAIFENRFGPYPYTELDIVEAPLVGGAGGVEFSGLVTVAMMFYRPGSASSGGMGGMLGALSGMGGAQGAGGAQGGSQMEQMATSMREFVTAHEVAHQWWHGLVGSDSRAHPWVDESLAQYSAMIYIQERYGDARAMEEGERQVAMNYRMMRVQGEADALVDRPASAFTTPMSYAGLVYGKGPFFYRAVRRLIGDTAFFAGLASYVQAFRFREAGPDDVVDHLARASASHQAAVHTLANRWLRQAHGDDDLGPSNARSLMRTMMPPEMRGMLDDPMMGPLLEQMMGSMLGGGGGGASGGTGGMEIDPSMLQQLQSLQQGLGGQ